MLVAEQPGDQRRCDADGADRLALGVDLADEPRHLGMHAARGTLDREVAEVLGGPEAAREDQRVDVRTGDAREVGDVPPRNARRLHQHVPRLSRHLAGEVVDNVELRRVRGGADGLRAGAIESQQREHRLVNLSPVVDAAPREDDTNSRSRHESTLRIPSS